METEETISAHVAWCLIDKFCIWMLLDMMFVPVRFRVTKGHISFLGNINPLPKVILQSEISMLIFFKFPRLRMQQARTCEIWLNFSWWAFLHSLSQKQTAIPTALKPGAITSPIILAEVVGKQTNQRKLAGADRERERESGASQMCHVISFQSSNVVHMWQFYDRCRKDESLCEVWADPSN